MGVVAVFDVGKTNVKLFAATPEGELLEHMSAPNRTMEGPPYRHHDLAALEDWFLEGLRDLGRRHAIEAVVTCAHGSGGVLVGETDPILPMMDYEQDVPAEIARDYAETVGSYRERGSAVMLGAAHLARQMLWMERAWPEAFAAARAFLATPQYWAFRLCGVAAGEVTSLAAQSHLWCPADARPAWLVARRGWERLMPPMRRAYETLGRLKPELARRTGLSPDTRVLCGIHDSSANFYRYQAAGLADLTVVSTGTWIVTLSDRADAGFDEERPGRSCNADVFGRPMPGMLTMGGREFQLVAGEASGPASADMLRRIVESRTAALPAFGPDDGLFPCMARQGRLVGPLAGEKDARFTLAVLYTALLAGACLDGLPPARTIVLDGGFVQEPMFGALVAALHPEARVLVNHDPFGTAMGAALLARHETRARPASLNVEEPDMSGLPDLSPYRAFWRGLTRRMDRAS